LGYLGIVRAIINARLRFCVRECGARPNDGFAKVSGNYSRFWRNFPQHSEAKAIDIRD
jgi:hypothetical protein